MTSTTSEFPSASVVAQAESTLSELTTQKRRAEIRLAELSNEQGQLHQEQQRLTNEQARLQAEAEQQHKALRQAETDAILAAASPIALKSATARLHELREGIESTETTRKKRLAEIAHREAEIAKRLQELQPLVHKEQSTITDLAEQIGMVQKSRNDAFASLGNEMYAAGAARLDQSRARLEDLASQLVEAHIEDRRAKEDLYQKLGQHWELREEAIKRFDLLEDPLSRLLDAYAQFCNVVMTETGAGRLPRQIGNGSQHYLPRDLAITQREWEAIFENPKQAEPTLRAKQNAAEQFKLHYQVRPE